MKIGSLFTGYGGLDMAVEGHFGAETVWTSEIDPGASKIIAHRFAGPNHGDLTKIDWATVEPVDILTGGFPCQDLSHAGKRAGLRPGTRSGLWSHMAYAISQLRPRYVVAENVRGLLSAAAHSSVEQCAWCVGGSGDGEPDLRALGAVLGDLADLGYDARWVGLRAADVGAPHGRFRVFVVATDTRSVRGDSGRVAAPGQATSGRPLCSPPRRGRAHLVADSNEPGPQGNWTFRCRAAQSELVSHQGTPADPQGHGRDKGRAEPAGLVGRPHAAVSGDAATDPDIDGLTQLGRVDTVERHSDGRGRADVAWGAYEPAIRRWEAVTGQLAPAPTERGPKGGQRLAPRFVEWMMGCPAGWVTDVPNLSRNAQLKALGNGVVRQQALRGMEVLAA